MNKVKILLIVGLVFLCIGGFLSFSSKEKSKDNLDIALNATNAQEAAEMISKNNRSEIGQNTLGMGLLGFGGALTVVSLINLLKKRK